MCGVFILLFEFKFFFLCCIFVMLSDIRYLLSLLSASFLFMLFRILNCVNLC